MSTVTGTLTIQAGDPYTSSVSVSLFLTSNSSAGTVTQMRLGNDGVLGAPEPFASNKLWTLAATDGVRTVNVQLIDSLGATFSTSDTITLDRTGPFGSFIVAGGATVTNSTTVPLQLTYTDANPGMTVRIQIDGGAFSAAVPYASTLNATIPAVDGAHTITVQVIDAAGNPATLVTQPITLDRVAPAGEGPYLLLGEINGENYSQTNTRTPAMIAYLTDTTQLGAYCVAVSDSGVVPANPLANDPCWRPIGGTEVRVPVTPQFTSDEKINRVTVFIRDAAGTLGSTFKEITYDATVPTGGAVVLTQADAGHRSVEALASFGTLPTGVVHMEVGINPSNGGTADPNLFIWSRNAWYPAPNSSQRLRAEAANGPVYSYAVRFADEAGNGGPMSNVITNLRPRAAFEPIYTLPTGQKLDRVVRIPLANGSRFLVEGEYDNLYSSDDQGLTWTKRDALSHGHSMGMAVSSNGVVLALNNFSPPNGDTFFNISADLGVFFRNVMRLDHRNAAFDSSYESPTFISRSAQGVNTFAFLEQFEGGVPMFMTLDARNQPLEVGQGITPFEQGASIKLTGLAGCANGYGGAIGITPKRIFRSRDEGRTYDEMTVPAGWPATADFRFVSGFGTSVVIVAQRSAGVVALLRNDSCGTGPWAEVSGLNLPVDRLPVALSMPGPDRAWLLMRATASEAVTITKVDFTSPSAGLTQHLPWTPQARLNAISGDNANTVVVVGDRGEVYSTGSFPSFASRRSRPLENFTSLSVRAGTPAASALTGSVVVVGGTTGRVAYSTNSGATFVDASFAAATGPMFVSATHVVNGGIGALEFPGALWFNPQTGWQGATPASAIAAPYRAINCYGPTCFVAGSSGAIASMVASGSVVTGSFAVAPTGASTLDWFDIDGIETPSGPAFVAVGGNGQFAFSQARLAGATAFSTAASSPAVGSAATLTRVAFKRTATGEALALASNGSVWQSTNFGQAFSTGLNLGQPVSWADVTHLSGNTWLLSAGRRLSLFELTGSTVSNLRQLRLGTNSNIIGMEVSDSDPNVVWLLTSDGSMYLSRVGARE